MVKLAALILTLTIPNIALAQQLSDGRYSKTVAAGTKVMLKASYSINPDCTSRGEVTIQATGGPAHGRLSTKKGMDFPYTDKPPYNECNTKRVKAVELWYAPDPGYVGPDAVTTEIFYPDGKSRKDRYEITVK